MMRACEKKEEEQLADPTADVYSMVAHVIERVTWRSVREQTRRRRLHG